MAEIVFPWLHNYNLRSDNFKRQICLEITRYIVILHQFFSIVKL
jgi:hypothetical protein